MKTPKDFMRRALNIAEKARGRANPNPTVGAVIVKNGNIVGEGTTSKVGGPHAEINALNQAGSNSKNSELYVTLEPCSFRGKTPPCCEAIVQAGIAKVHCALIDPDPRVNGEGILFLRSNGLQVESGLLEQDAARMHVAHITHRTQNRPHTILKLAQTLDGQIASNLGDSQWITSLESRRHAHRWRSFVDAVVVGANTVNVDDPQLNVRHIRGRNPRPVVIDGLLRTNPKASLFSRDGAILATGNHTSLQKRRKIAKTGTEMWTFPTFKGRIDLHTFVQRAAKAQIISMIVEGGSNLAAGFLHAQLVDTIHAYIAPRLLGRGIPAIGDLHINKISESLSLNQVQTHYLGPDILYEGEVKYPCSLES